MAAATPMSIAEDRKAFQSACMRHKRALVHGLKFVSDK